jgi:cytochrome oxidase assembly protein ShyY1
MVLLGFVPIFTLGLGTWQLQRLQWKVNLIDELEEKLQLPPLSLPKRIKCGHPSVHLLMDLKPDFRPKSFSNP